MKRTGLLMACLLVSFCSLAQSITIIDQNSLNVIEGVKVFTLKNTDPIGESDANGTVQLKGLFSTDILVFTHPMYTKLQLTMEQLGQMGNVVRLTENVNSIDEIVVSASKFEEKRKDVSQKIQVIRASEIQNMNQTSTADVLANSGNIMVQKSQLGGGSPIIRGFETNKVLIVIDGIRMNNAIYRGGHLQNVITLDNSIMDRVEIVFGPGSVVYGSDALGGVMSMTTKNPELSSNGKKKVKAGGYTRYNSAATGYAAHGDVSIGGKKFGSLTSFTYSHFGDLRQGANREPFVGNFGARPWFVNRVNGKDSIFVNADTNVQVGSGYTQYDILQKFLFQQNENVKHIVNLQYSSSGDIPRYDRLVQVSSSGLPRFAEWYYGPQERLLASYTLQLTNKNSLYDNARFIVGYQKIEESRIDRRFNNENRNHRVENLDIYTVNLDLAKKIGRNELRYGLEGWYNPVESTAYTEDIETGLISPLDTRYASGGANMQSLAIYATHTFEINDKLILNDGLRFSAIGLNAKFTDTTFFNFPFAEANQRNTALTGNLGLIYMPTEESRITALVSSGFRAPNVDDLSKVFESTPENLVVPNNNLRPEYTVNGEIGISQRIGKGVYAQATGYYTSYRNAISLGGFTYQGEDSVIYNGTMSKVVAAQNNDKAYMYGLELTLNGRMNDHMTMYATYNYTYARIVTDSVAIPLDHIPPAFGKFGVQINNKKFRGDLFVNYSGWKRIEDYRLNAEDNEAYALPEGMPSWYTINARVTYQFNKIVGLQIACENILDRNYRVFASNISAPGRNFILTLRGSF
ncbi:MAG: TonB-dependent receptor plug domain-containing protein [Flavobacteriales bacterium]